MAAEAEPAPEAVEPAAGVEAAEPEADTVGLTIRTNVDADILDAGDLGLFGHTNADAPVMLDRADGPIGLVLRADGYAEYPLTVTPDQDLDLQIELVPLEGAGPSRPSKPGKRRKKAKSGAPEPEPEVQKPAKDPESIEGAKLRDPW
jgi:hypothetical protein